MAKVWWIWKKNTMKAPKMSDVREKIKLPAMVQELKDLRAETKALTAERDALREQVGDLNQSHVRISIEEYQELKKKDEILERLWTDGVENWHGYDPCVEDIEGMEKYRY